MCTFSGADNQNSAVIQNMRRRAGRKNQLLRKSDHLDTIRALHRTRRSRSAKRSSSTTRSTEMPSIGFQSAIGSQANKQPGRSDLLWDVPKTHTEASDPGRLLQVTRDSRTATQALRESDPLRKGQLCQISVSDKGVNPLWSQRPQSHRSRRSEHGGGTNRQMEGAAMSETIEFKPPKPLTMSQEIRAETETELLRTLGPEGLRKHQLESSTHRMATRRPAAIPPRPNRHLLAPAPDATHLSAAHVTAAHRFSTEASTLGGGKASEYDPDRNARERQRQRREARAMHNKANIERVASSYLFEDRRRALQSVRLHNNHHPPPLQVTHDPSCQRFVYAA